MGNFFERCRQCRACCRTSDRFIHIHVCDHEQRLRGRLAAGGMDPKEITVPYAASCRFLGDRGCELGDLKPFQCRLYPLLFLSDGSLGIDPACAHSGEYLSQLPDPSSDARRHFDSMRREAAVLGEGEKRCLAEWSRYVCDAVTIDDTLNNYN